MAMPVVTNQIALRMYERLDPVGYAEAKYDYTLLRWLDAWSESMVWLDSLVRDDRESDRQGWTRLLDPDMTPDEALDYLGQYIGLTFNPTLSPDIKRERLTSGRGLHRGSPRALVAAVQEVLDGTRTVYLIERHGSPYRFTLGVLASETPSTDFIDLTADNCVNFEVNPAFEGPVSDWSSYSGSVITGGTTAHSGTHGLSVVASGGSDASAYKIYDDADLAKPGRTVSVTFQVRSFGQPPDVLSSLSYYLYGLDDSLTATLGSPGITLRIEEDTLLANGAWTPVTMTGVIPARTTSFELGFSINNYPLFIDDIVICLGPPMDFVDGDVDGWEWEGSANASRSLRLPTTSKVRNAALSQKPAGLVMNLIYMTADDYDSLLASHATYDELVTDFATYDDVATNPTHT